ncbi:MAG TPA: RagB/SusD family nutrient uptake outer membrane protein [Cyclobacteriaceae bacterium]|nr:RagB/SusD family nutrient uptake outer membrane protein [Cyclobacteriaceae bacterium]HNU41479.1 RagB/SusD family nutrient uptake outer membrane protein [Cyclobacteriaceae bacterium]
MKKIYSFLLLALSVMWSSSCSDYLDFKETDLIAGDVALKTVANNESAIMGAYGGVDNLMGVLLNSVFSDEVKTAGEFYNASTTHEWKYGPADVGLRDSYTAIDPQYRVIDRVNRVLALIDNADSTRVGDNTLRNRLRGEALFLRAYAHFELYRFYGAKYSPTGLAMPYMEAPSMLPQARIATAEYFQKLNRDINDAKALLPNNLTDINRANVAAANGLHARIALYEEKWADAETFATSYIDAVPLATLATFPGIWTDANTAEQAYRIVRTSSMGRIGSLYRNTSANASNIGTIVWTVSNKLYDSYADTDIRKAAYFIVDPTLAAANRPNADRPGLIIYKYNGGAYGTTTENLVNSKVMRTSEMYLLRAEARAEQGKITGANSAESDLNTLRANRITDHVDIVLATKDQAITEILTERFKELAFEGHRFWDLKRKGLAVARLAVDAVSADGTTLPAGDFRFALPIPDPEMKANSAMVQNTGY